ncbi:iron chaperone [Leeuwenhoekiella nanhaiensis]|uniref:YdhG-like domain-containing protein n=1 Tax=Leeuwenhoekiella nanhaiensis TaxID=1655491 RepID=A0A2G1VX11_9FLAO|nr:DUF1801 domain-containing protein [Leeuwenhoekiella nanhaiensis]PHQ31314.1 hypothetical protein CJ305_03625 [Leeuwenhoekiella nanhaiensis]
MNTTKATNVDDYIAEFPQEVQERMRILRRLILDCAPDATESISYHMPAYKLNKKPFVYFGGFANHIGFYAQPVTHDTFKDELAAYKHGKGSVQFPHHKPLPEKLIRKMLQFKKEQLNKL